MMTKTLFWMSVVTFLAGVAEVRAADSMSAVKDRMAERLPVINELKRDQLVGENNRGYLTILERGDLDKKQRQAVDGENDDRKKVYEFIAEKTGSTEKLVGERRAVQIAKQSAPGIMLQDRHGKWYEKEDG